MRFGLQGDNTLYVLYTEPVAGALVCWSKLLYGRSLGKSNIVFIGGKYLVLVFLSGLLNHGKQGIFHLLAVDDERTAENLVTTVFTVNLGKTEDFRVCQSAAVLLLYMVKVGNLFF